MSERPTPRTDAWRKQDMHTLDRAFQFMERLEREGDEWKEKWADLARSAPKDIGDLERQLAETKKQRDRLANACRSAKLCLNGEALPTRHRAIQIINAALDSIA